MRLIHRPDSNIWVISVEKHLIRTTGCTDSNVRGLVDTNVAVEGTAAANDQKITRIQRGIAHESILFNQRNRADFGSQRVV